MSAGWRPRLSGMRASSHVGGRRSGVISLRLPARLDKSPARLLPLRWPPLQTHHSIAKDPDSFAARVGITCTALPTARLPPVQRAGHFHEGLSGSWSNGSNPVNNTWWVMAGSKRRNLKHLPRSCAILHGRLAEHTLRNAPCQHAAGRPHTPVLTACGNGPSPSADDRPLVCGALLRNHRTPLLKATTTHTPSPPFPHGRWPGPQRAVAGRHFNPPGIAPGDDGR